MKMETLPVATAVEWVTAWTGLTWPVPAETAFAIRDRLGWVADPVDGRFFTTVLTLPSQKHGGAISLHEAKLFSGIMFALTTCVPFGQEEPDTASVTWVAYQSYVEALTDLFGEPRTQARRVGTDSEFRQAKWYLPNRSSFSLNAQTGLIQVMVYSPEQTWADLEDQRLTEKYGEGWEDRLD